MYLLIIDFLAETFSVDVISEEEGEGKKDANDNGKFVSDVHGDRTDFSIQLDLFAGAGANEQLEPRNEADAGEREVRA